MNILLLLAKTLEKQKSNFPHTAVFHMKTKASLKYFVNDCLWKHVLASNSPQNPSNLTSLVILVIVRPLT